MNKYDVIIIGGGPGGYSSAILAAKAGLTVALFEKEKLGGTCLNVGCIPTKFLIDKAKILAGIRRLTSEGILKDAGAFSYKTIQKNKTAIVNKLTDGVAYLLKKYGVTVITGAARLRNNKVVECSGIDYSGDAIILASGSEPSSLKIPGIEYAINSTQMLECLVVPKRLIVIGGGVIGLEMACAFSSFGSEVTIIEVQDKLIPQELHQASITLTENLRSSGITIITSAKVKTIIKQTGYCSVVYEKEGEEVQIDGETVLSATGRKPNLCCLDPALNIELLPDSTINVDSFMRTSLDGVYAIGDLVPGYQLAHAAYSEADIAVSSIVSQEKSTDRGNSIIPRCIYTIPSFAAVGPSPMEIESDTVIGSFSYENNGMALAEGASGIVFVIMDKNKKITLGVQIVGDDSPELISLATVAVKLRFTVDDWRNLIIAHPTLAEMLKEASLDAFAMAIHK